MKALLMMFKQIKTVQNNQAIAVSYFSIAAEHYKLACRLSAKQSQANNVVSTIEKSAQTCLLDPLVSYARLLHVEQIEENISDLSIKLFSIAANRNNPLAQVVMGFNCYENKKYRQASKLFHKAEKQQHPLAYKGLFFIYHKSQTKMVDDKKAYFYLKKGIALDCIDCKAELGYAMYKGNLIPQNQNEGKRLIEMSAKLGSVEGFKYMCEMLIDELPI